MTTLLRFEATKTLKIEDSVLQNWLTLIEANYHSANSYHNSSHAADVLQVTQSDEDDSCLIVIITGHRVFSGKVPGV